jgi:hypothetical protein
VQATSMTQKRQQAKLDPDPQHADPIERQPPPPEALCRHAL